MKRLSLAIVLMFLLMVVFSSTGSAFEENSSNESEIHECVFVYDVDGEEQSFTSYAEECPDDEGWWDNGPADGVVANAEFTVLTSQEKASETLDLHECVFLYDVDGEERTLTVYAEECPVDGVWLDNGPTISAVGDDNDSTRSLMSLSAVPTDYEDHKCVYTYYIFSEKHYYTVCAPICPDHPDWRDVGTPCP